MTERLVIASRNENKVREIRVLLTGLPFAVLSARELTDLDVDEDGKTFAANAGKKALEISRAVGLRALADDSGLVVDALGGQPGVLSARFAGEPADDERNNEKLLDMLAGVPDEKRSARFVCVAALADPLGNLRLWQGEVSGRILFGRRGPSGFGYDPLFIPNGYDKTFAELSMEEKNRISHRGQALLKVRRYLEGDE